MKDNPLVSIIINNYNYGRFLGEAIDSVLKQTYSPIEVIVVDDGSTDDSPEIIASYGKKIIPVLKENGGQASAFNAGFATSRGDIICFLDADDTFFPEKVAEVIEIFKLYQEIGWCFHPVGFLDTETNSLIEKTYQALPCNCDFRALTKKGKLPYIPTATSGLCLSRSLLKLILPMPETETVSLSDNYLNFTALALNKGYFLNKKLATQKIHGNKAYTFRKETEKLKAKIHILTAYYIRFNFPALSRVANSIFVGGIVIFWRSRAIDTESKEFVKSYLASIGILEKLKINSRVIYRYLRA